MQHLIECDSTIPQLSFAQRLQGLLLYHFYFTKWPLEVSSNQFGLEINSHYHKGIPTFARIIPIGASFDPERASNNPFFDKDGT